MRGAAGLPQNSLGSHRQRIRCLKPLVLVCGLGLLIIILERARHVTAPAPISATVTGHTGGRGPLLTDLRLSNQSTHAYGYQVDSEFSPGTNSIYLTAS